MKSDDNLFIKECSLIGKQNFVVKIQRVYKLDNIILAKCLDQLWFDVSNFEYDNKMGYWREIASNDDVKDLAKYDKD